MAQGFPEGTYIRFNQVPTNLQADITKELGAFRFVVASLSTERVPADESEDKTNIRQPSSSRLRTH
ncbi:hypothetical protein HPB48_008282 [Haemaphysalis longicornis]|uniref:Uncharacterized protein n=1 Tax=Haemaphysalis longicornis TaxID=44386 RepID=A0A9J6GP16_HAELO|nr:hypothetical protein HPB48_008282 [Haemaphysalis longicornis]